MSIFSSRKKSRRRRHNGLLPSHTIRGLVTIFILLLGGVGMFSILGLAGPFGVHVNSLLIFLFGRAAWLLPIYLIAVAAIRIWNIERPGIVVLGLTLMLLSLTSLFDLALPLNETLRESLETEGGGVVGLYLRYPMETVFGFWVMVLAVVAVLLASILLTFDVTLEALLARPIKFLIDIIRGFFARRGVGNEDEEEDEYEGDDEEEKEKSKIWLPSFIRRSADGVDEEEDDEEYYEDEENEEDEEEGGEEEDSGNSQRPLPGTDRFKKPVKVRYKPITIDLPLSLLELSTEKPTSGDLKANKFTIKKTLENFGISVEMGEVSVGPTVTQYTLKPDDGVKLSAITALINDLSLALAAHPIRIEAPIPGRSLVGIEVPNAAVATVQLRELLESDEFQKRQSDLMLAVGKDVTGKPWVVDLAGMPHLLVAGATGSGKSVALNGVILSLLYQNNPSDLKLILVDPKRVEFSIYKHMPHLLTPIITEVPATVNALKWLLGEMDRRFNVLSELGYRNIQAHNQSENEKMPYIVLIIDELADIMVAAASEVEAAIIRLAQMARAVGIHLILATQRPSVDVITGLIKANITARVAFSVASITDSRTILDSGGAEKLLGRGDLLYISAEIAKPKRLQGAYLGDREIKKVMKYLRDKASPEYISEVTKKQSQGGYGTISDEDGDSLYNEAETLIIETGKASASYLQRRLKVGYARAARLLDLLEARGVIGPGEGAKPREVLMTREERDMLEDVNERNEEDYEDEEDNNEE